MLHISYRRIKRYLNDDAEVLCRDGRSSRVFTSSVTNYHETITDLLNNGYSYKEVLKKIQKLGFQGCYSIVANYYMNHFGSKKNCTKNAISAVNYHCVDRSEILAHIWSDKPMDTYDKQYIFSLYPGLFCIKDLVYQFRRTMYSKETQAIIEWTENTLKFSSYTTIVSFANGMKRDIQPIINSVKYEFTNACLEGNVNRLKMIKRTMFGRAGYDLLRAKVVSFENTSYK